MVDEEWDVILVGAGQNNFALGAYLGNLVRERVLVTGLRFAAAGIGTALILWLLGARLL